MKIINQLLVPIIILSDIYLTS